MGTRWMWEKVGDDEYVLKDANGHKIAWLMKAYNDFWCCKFWHSNQHCGVTFDNVKNLEQVMWQATLWIDNECNAIANKYHYIRDHLPDLHELYEEYAKTVLYGK